jgi:curved DNA-binding protein
MVDYYDALGIKEDASNAEIKKSFRKLAQTHHPDMGGQEKKFKEINEAYDTLKDLKKKEEYDNMRNWQSRDGNFTSGFPFQDLGDIPGGLGAVFQHVFNEGFGPGRGHSNRAINIQLDVTLEEIYKGVEKQLELQLPNGQVRSVNISIPAGIQHGTRIRYAGLGEIGHPQFPTGDLILVINELHKKDWQREGDDLVTIVTMDVFDAILGCELHISHLDGKLLNVKIPTGTQSGQRIRIKGKGIVNTNTRNIGNLFLITNVIIPDGNRLNTEQRTLVKEIKTLRSKTR